MPPTRSKGSTVKPETDARRKWLANFYPKPEGLPKKAKIVASGNSENFSRWHYSVPNVYGGFFSAFAGEKMSEEERETRVSELDQAMGTTKKKRGTGTMAPLHDSASSDIHCAIA
jgi:hypothetical protein